MSDRLCGVRAGPGTSESMDRRTESPAMTTLTPTAMGTPPARNTVPAVRDIRALLTSRAFVGIVFVATVIQVLGDPLMAMLSGTFVWDVPLPAAAVITLVVVGCGVQAASLLRLDRRPVLAMLGTLVCYLVVALVGGIPTWTGAMQLVVAFALFALATRVRPAVAVAWLVTAISITVGALTVWAMSLGAPAGVVSGFVLNDGLAFAVPAAAGTALGLLWSVHAARATEAEEQAERLLREHEEKVGQARDTERARVAQELHDVAGQHIAGLVSLCDASAELAPDQPDRALQLIDEVRAEGRFAAASLYGALSDLRAVNAESAAATPDLRGAAELVQFWSRRGMALTCRTSGDVVNLPAVVSTIAYRGLQEALANAAKHAPGSTVEVHVTMQSDQVRVSVANTAAAAVRRPEERLGLGWGLDGLRDRLLLVDGTLHAAADDSGGWRTQFDIPFPVIDGGLNA
jgi:signal transduction histidine kinase